MLWCVVLRCCVVSCGVVWSRLVWCGVVCRRRCYQKAMAGMVLHKPRCPLPTAVWQCTAGSPLPHCPRAVWQCAEGSRKPKCWPRQCPPTRARRHRGQGPAIAPSGRAQSVPRAARDGSCPAPQWVTALYHRCTTHYTQNARRHTALPACIVLCPPLHSHTAVSSGQWGPQDSLPFGCDTFASHRLGQWAVELMLHTASLP